MNPVEPSWVTTSTHNERVALAAAINLADGHARVFDDPSVSQAFAEAPRLFEWAIRRPQHGLEGDFVAEFERLHGLSFPRRPILSYSASTLASLVGIALGSRTNIIWGAPSFDNVRDVVRSAGPAVNIVDEQRLAEIIDTHRREPRYQAIWLTTPNNPTGTVLSASQYLAVARHAARHKLTLIFDHCFRAFSPTMSAFDQYSMLEDTGCSYIALEDTGKTLSTHDLKIGMAIASADRHEDIRLLNEDLLLNVSPFTLAVLTSIMSAWQTSGGQHRLVTKIAANRRAIRASLRVRPFLVDSLHTTEVPFEWLRAPAVGTAEKFIRTCAQQGLHLLPGESFFSGSNLSGKDYLRIALSRDVELIESAARILRSVVGELDVEACATEGGDRKSES